FDSLIVAIHRLAAVIDGGECPVFEAQRNDGGIDIARFADSRIDQGRANGIDLLSVAAAEEANHVEIVNRHVEKKASGGLDIIQWRRGRVTTGDTDKVRVADGAGCDQLPDLRETGIETAVKADLQVDTRRIDGCEGRMDALEIVIDGFLP